MKPRSISIVLSAVEVLAVREGQATIRRKVKPQPPAGYNRVSEYVYSPTYSARWENDGPPGTLGMWTKRCPYGGPGDRLWVREVWSTLLDYDGARVALVYRADRAARNVDLHGTKPELLRMLSLSPDVPPLPDGANVAWQLAITMPRWASRLTVEVVDVAVEGSGTNWEWLLTLKREGGAR